MITKEFITAGRAIFTLENAAGFHTSDGCAPHYTFKVTEKEFDGRTLYFVALLTGPNNEADYSYLGVLNPKTGEVRLTKASKLTDESWPIRLLRRVLARVWSDQGEMIKEAGFNLHHEGRCGRCGRVLTVPESIELGLGPECAGKI